MKYYGRLFGEQNGKRTRYWDTGKTGKDWEEIEKERDSLRDAVRKLRDAKGRHHTQLAYEELVQLLPENSQDRSSGTG